MTITGHHLTPDNDLQRSECVADCGTLCRRLVRGYEVDTATGAVKLNPPYATPQWEVYNERDHAWGAAYPDVFRNELEREFVNELLQQNLNQKTVLDIITP